MSFTLSNTGRAAPVADGIHPISAASYLDGDVYRLSVTVEGDGWKAAVQNALVAVKVGASHAVPVFVAREAKSASRARVTLTATSESDPTKTVKATVRLR